MTSTYEMTPQTLQPEHEPRTAERFFVLDFDRTLVDSDVLAEKIYDVVVQETGVQKQTFTDEQKRFENDRESVVVDMWKVIEDVLSGTGSDLAALRQTIVATVRETSGEAWLPGAPELLDLLQSNNADFGIVSRGADGWQRLKLACMGLESVPTIITDGHHKSIDHMNTWYDDDQAGFSIPSKLSRDGQSVMAENIISVDDRAAAFVESHEGISGYWVRTGANKQYDGLDFNRFKACDNLETVVADLRVRYFSDAA